MYAWYQDILGCSLFSRAIWCTKIMPPKHEFRNWMIFRIIMCQTSRLHIGEYTVQNLEESIKNWMKYNIFKIRCLFIIIVYMYKDYYYQLLPTHLIFKMLYLTQSLMDSPESWTVHYLIWNLCVWPQIYSIIIWSCFCIAAENILFSSSVFNLFSWFCSTIVIRPHFHK